MSIRIAFPAQFAELTGGAGSVTVEATTVGEALARLTERFPALASLVWLRGAFASGGAAASGPPASTGGGRTELNPVIVVFLNGEDVRHRGGLAAALRDGDELTVISAVEGG